LGKKIFGLAPAPSAAPPAWGLSFVMVIGKKKNWGEKGCRQGPHFSFKPFEPKTRRGKPWGEQNRGGPGFNAVGPAFGRLAGGWVFSTRG